MSGINWQPIKAIPDALKDEREVLLWQPGGATVCTWRYGGWFVGYVSEIDSSPLFCEDATHYAEIEGPA